MPALIPMQRARPRVTFRSRAPTFVGRRNLRRPSRCWARFSRDGHRTVQRHFLRGFDHMEGRCCQCGSQSRQTGAMVYRMAISVEPVGRSDRLESFASARAPMAESGVESADGLLFYASTVPGSHRAGPCDPGGAPYGRTEYGRSRRAAGRNPRRGKVVKYSITRLRSGRP